MLAAITEQDQDLACAQEDTSKEYILSIPVSNVDDEILPEPIVEGIIAAFKRRIDAVLLGESPSERAKRSLSLRMCRTMTVVDMNSLQFNQSPINAGLRGDRRLTASSFRLPTACIFGLFHKQINRVEFSKTVT